MNVGLIGCGNMARAMARGWGRAGVCFDSLAACAEGVGPGAGGGEALDSTLAVAQRADIVVLCHKPPQLGKIAQEVAPAAKAVASILASTPLSALENAYPGLPVYRFLPSLPVEVRRGAIVQAINSKREHAENVTIDVEVRELFGQLGTLVTLDDSLVDVAMGLMSCAPAYVALVAEAQVDAGVRRGIPPAQASALVTETLAGTAELLRERGYDTLAVRREVASPGGTTARGLAALERGGLRAAFSDALDAVLG